MSNWVWCCFLACASVFGQSTSDNAAADALKKRMLSMNLLNPPAPKRIVLAGPVTPPSKICAIPPLRVVPPGTTDKMPVIKPQGTVLRGDNVRVPAPACDENLFTNK